MIGEEISSVQISLWIIFPFQNFTVGLLRQMGKEIYEDVDIAVDVLKSILANYEADLVYSTVTPRIK